MREGKLLAIADAIVATAVIAAVIAMVIAIVGYSGWCCGYAWRMAAIIAGAFATLTKFNFATDAQIWGPAFTISPGIVEVCEYLVAESFCLC